MINEVPQHLFDQIAAARCSAIFLDYDGTLADFAPTPDQINPEPEVITLLTRLSRFPQLRVSVISGRRLAYVQALLPVSNILLAGTYGLELQLPDGKLIHRAKLNEIRPALDRLKPPWTQLIAGRTGFNLEDKVWALALHARYAEDSEAQAVMEQARDIARGVISWEQFSWSAGHKFCEVAPISADKGATVTSLLNSYAEPGLLPVYIGDDDMDEKAFAAVKSQGGRAILVAGQPRRTRADYRLSSPAQVRQWLGELAARLTAENK